MRSLVPLSGVLIATVGIVSLTVVAWAAPTAQSGPTLNVVVGQGDGVVRMNGFVPDTLRVAVGTTVTWTVGSDDEHTVAFLAGTQGPLDRAIPQPEDPTGRPPMANPLVWDAVPPRGPYDGSYLINSGPLGRGQTFSATFSKAGTYPFLCTLHAREMTGTLEVVPPGSPGVTTQEQADAEAATHVPAVHEPEIARMMAARNSAVKIDGPGGADTWFVRAGTGWRGGHLDVDAFLPNSLTVRQGDTVVWAADHAVPHTVTFLPPGQPPLDIWAPALPDGTMIRPGMTPPDPSVQPRLVAVNRGAVRPSPTYDGASLYSSGQFGGEPPSPRGIAWSLAFDTPGTFEYICLLHSSHGMKGRITVEPR